MIVLELIVGIILAIAVGKKIDENQKAKRRARIVQPPKKKYQRRNISITDQSDRIAKTSMTNKMLKAIEGVASEYDIARWSQLHHAVQTKD